MQQFELELLFERLFVVFVFLFVEYKDNKNKAPKQQHTKPQSIFFSLFYSYFTSICLIIALQKHIFKTKFDKFLISFQILFDEDMFCVNMNIWLELILLKQKGSKNKSLALQKCFANMSLNTQTNSLTLMCILLDFGQQKKLF